MAAETGKRLECADLGAQYMITKGGDGELSCTPATDGEADQLGKRYQDETTGIMVLCTKAGTSRINLRRASHGDAGGAQTAVVRLGTFLPRDQGFSHS